MTVEILPQSDLREARERAARIRIGMVSYLTTLADIRSAWDRRDWLTLGYKDWDAYLDGEFSEHRLRVPAEHRDKAITELRMAGMSQRAIATTIQTPQSTVGDVARRLTGSGQMEQPARVTGRDGSDRPATRPSRHDSVPPDEGGTAARRTRRGSGRRTTGTTTRSANCCRS